MIGSIIRTLFGRSRRAAIANSAKEERSTEHRLSMQILNMKVAALQVGAERMLDECEKTRDAASVLMQKVKRDF